MEPITVRPEKSYRTAMYIVWFIVLVLVSAALIPAIMFIPDREGRIVFGVLYGGFGLVMLFWVAWIPFYFRSLYYEIGPNSVITEGGVFWKRRATVHYSRVTNVDISQGPLERMFGIGKVHVQTAGAGGAEGSRAEARLAGIDTYIALKDRIVEIIDSREEGTRPAGSSPQSPGMPSDASSLERIHAELVAIRKVLERGGRK